MILARPPRIMSHPVPVVQGGKRRIKMKYIDAYEIAESGIPFNECKLEGHTEFTQTEVYSIPDEYADVVGDSLKIVGCFGRRTDNGIFTER